MSFEKVVFKSGSRYFYLSRLVLRIKFYCTNHIPFGEVFFFSKKYVDSNYHIWSFFEKKNFAKSTKWGMICTGNLILRTMVLENFNNSLYFKSYMGFLVKFGFTPIQKRALKTAILFSIGVLDHP